MTCDEKLFVSVSEIARSSELILYVSFFNEANLNYFSIVLGG
jgi:hypothetical protein